MIPALVVTGAGVLYVLIVGLCGRARRDQPPPPPPLPPTGRCAYCHGIGHHHSFCLITNR